MKLIERRVGLLFATFCLLLVLVVGRAAWLQGVKGGQYQAEAAGQQTQTVVVPGSRGAILDRKGKELAVSEDAATVFATPYQVTDPAKTASKLASILDLSSGDVLKDLADRQSGFAYIAHKVDLATAEKIRKLKLDGIGLLPDSRRIYPQGELASQVIGTVGSENQGLTGLEQSEETALHGSDGQREVVRDGLGDELERNTINQETTGSDLKLTIDSAIQSRTEDVLKGIGERYQPAGATAIVMDPRTSEVLAMANWPPVDPANLNGVDPSELQNMATGFTFEPGSTFKAFTVGGALQEHLVTPDTVFDLPPSIQVADRTIEDAEQRPAESLTVSQILAQSSNVGAVKIGLQLGGTEFDKWVRRFGFGKATGIRYPGEEQGIVIDPKDYSGSTMGNLPIGQGLAVTPIQMATAYSAIADGGVLHPPRLILDENGDPVSSGAGHRVIKKKTASQLSTMLEGVLAPGGTASEVCVPGYTLAGKTGTAQKVIDGTYSDSQFVASFIGFAPANNPKLLVSVVVDDPKGDYYGGTVAAPAFSEISQFALPYLGIAPDHQTSDTSCASTP